MTVFIYFNLGHYDKLCKKMKLFFEFDQYSIHAVFTSIFLRISEDIQIVEFDSGEFEMENIYYFN